MQSRPRRTSSVQPGSARPGRGEKASTLKPPDLAGVALLRDLDEVAVAQLLAESTVQAVRRRAVVFHQGDPSHSAYLVLQGRLDIRVLLSDGTEMTMDVLGPGDLCGIAGLVGNFPRISTAVAARPSRLLQIPTPALRGAVERNPELLMHVTGHLMRRLTRAIQEQVANRTQRVYARVVVKLLTLAEPDEHGERRLPEGLSHQDLASMVGSTRATVTRVLQDLKRRGLLQVDTSTGCFVIAEAEKMSEFAESELLVSEVTIVP
jgi:CRP/FNR family transcriptional regulator, cyclic AMP receptor protein